jgi:hypothetical protein
VTQPVTAPWLVFAGAVLLVSVVCWAAGWAAARTGRQPDARVRLDEFTPPARPAVVGRVPVGPASLWPPPAAPETVEPRATAVMPAVPAADATVRRSPLLDRALGDLDQIRADAAALAQLPPPPPSLDGADDVLPTDDDDGPDGDGGPPDGPTPPAAPPAAPEPEPARYAAVLGPRYDWSRAGWDPLAPHRPPAALPAPGVPGPGFDWMRQQLTRAYQWWLGRVRQAAQRQAERRGDALAMPPEFADGSADTTMWIPPLRVVARVAVPRVAAPPEHPAGGHVPRHGLDEVPPSIADAIAAMTPGERARELVRQCGQAGWWPWADCLDRRTRIRLRAWAIARRHGREPLLGTFQLRGELPA